MRSVSPFVALVLSALAAPAGASPSRIASVLVYPDRAQVTRTVSLPCEGRPVAVFEGLPPSADRLSLRARAEGAQVESLVYEQRASDTRYGAEAEALEQRRQVLTRELAALDDAQESAQARWQLGARFNAVAVEQVQRELAAPRPDARAWTAALESALGAQLEAAARKAATLARERELRAEAQEVDARLAALAAASERGERRAEVRLTCTAQGEARVELSYLVGGAGWEPTYEARSDEAHGAVELTTLATVRQRTGEDWRGAKVTLSTAVPLQNATPPELRSLQLRASERPEERKVLVRRDEYREHARAGSGESALESGAQDLRASAQGLSVQLQVPDAADVPGDGTAVRLQVARTRLRATFHFRAVPKLLPAVFRVARLTNAAPFPLLPGSVELFRPSGFLGRQTLERVAQGAPFELTFGQDEGLRVERAVVDEVRRTQGLFGGRYRFRYAYRFTLANHHAGAEDVELAEHLPVSELDDVSVRLEDTTSAGYQLDTGDGIATWRVRLAPGERRTLELAFHVDVPTEYELGDL
ncbi:mucoidy inhibitor MuiA family protein [Aggregicoccus sp. 17bor-14]|uniref:mucoidy inhibitor MuiA family protein n=1 Tax=Myxococcaceae TaxID=31 RepID=UPI00129C5CEA|nr:MULTISPECIES: mucoidy inhibitor MuiA family protein [Myxococcaceae]MBF5043759.1 mucoidy inhibitor MuiA family protein [Simulacricoccus sp. 17bor-14]MRI89513.1 mucoidy inhibitor MuiA family protein [Aggregicoccus sp. 17bor-14]